MIGFTAEFGQDIEYVSFFSAFLFRLLKQNGILQSDPLASHYP